MLEDAYKRLQPHDDQRMWSCFVPQLRQAVYDPIIQEDIF
jgi:hypothetical protein